MGGICQSQNPGGEWKTVRSSVQVWKVLTYVRPRDKLRNQPKLKDPPPAHRNSQGSKQPKARKTGPPPHYVYRWMPQELAVSTISQSYRKSPGSARRGTEGQPRLSTRQASTAGRPNQRPGEGEVRSQPGRKDHQAHRNCKGS